VSRSEIGREQKGRKEILDRLGSSAESWQARLQKLCGSRLLGRFFAASLQRLRAIAQQFGLRRLPNFGGCPTA